MAFRWTQTLFTYSRFCFSVGITICKSRFRANELFLKPLRARLRLSWPFMFFADIYLRDQVVFVDALGHALHEIPLADRARVQGYAMDGSIEKGVNTC